MATAPMAPGGVMPIPTLPGTQGPEIVQTGGILPAGPAAVAVAESDAIKRMMLPTLIGTMSRLETEIKFRHAGHDQGADRGHRGAQEAARRAQDGAPAAEVIAAAENDPEVRAAEQKAKKLWGDYKYLKSVAQDPNDPRVLRVKGLAEAADKRGRAKLEVRQGRADGDRPPPGQGQRPDQATRSGRARPADLQEQHRLSREAARRRARSRSPRRRRRSRQTEEKPPMFDPHQDRHQHQHQPTRRLIAQAIRLQYRARSPRRGPRPSSRPRRPTQKDSKKQIIATSRPGCWASG